MQKHRFPGIGRLGGKISRKGLAAVLVSVLLLGGAAWLFIRCQNSTAGQPEPQMETEAAALSLSNGMEITELGQYAGIYMEDGTDEVVSGILMLVVKNHGQQDIQYAELTLTSETGETAAFSLSTLPAGQSMVVLEKNRLPYEEKTVYIHAEAENVVMFQEALSLQEGTLKLEVVDKAINITNISGVPINGTIILYYKNSSGGMLYGGITYRSRIEGGLAAGELRQLVPNHFAGDSSIILFVTVG